MIVKKMKMLAIATLLFMPPLSSQAMEESSYSANLRKQLLAEKIEIQADIRESDEQLMKVAKAAVDPQFEQSQKQRHYETVLAGKHRVDAINDNRINVLLTIKDRHDRQVGYYKQQCETFLANPRESYMKDFSEEDLKSATPEELAELEEDFNKEVASKTAEHTILLNQLERNTQIYQEIIALWNQERETAKNAWFQELAAVYGVNTNY